MKEPSEKARTAAFEVIVSMGKKMTLGGVVKMNLVEGMEDEAKDGISSNFFWYRMLINV
jgi:ribosomal RNA-processing protein 12